MFLLYTAMHAPLQSAVEALTQKLGEQYNICSVYLKKCNERTHSAATAQK